MSVNITGPILVRTSAQQNTELIDFRNLGVIDATLCLHSLHSREWAKYDCYRWMFVKYTCNIQ